MSLINQLTKLFSKAESTHVLGISLGQQYLAYCYAPTNKTATFQQLPSPDLLTAISTLKNEQQVQGQCHLVLSSGQYQIVQVDKPKVPEEEINGALKWQIKDLVSIAPDNMVLDYFDGPNLFGVEKINVVCASLSELQGVLAQLTKQDLSVKTITTEEFAFASLLPIQNDACLLVCQQPNTEILLLIVKQGQIFFHRHLRGFAQIASKSEEELMMGTIDSLSLEIQRSTDYFERQLKQAPIKQIQVIVPIVQEAFLARKLAENTNVPVELLSLPDEYKTQRAFAVTIGATRLQHSGGSE